MSIYNSSRSFKVISFFLKENSIFDGINLPSGFITVRLDAEHPIYHFFNYQPNANGVFHENTLGSSKVTSACAMFKQILGHKYQEEEDFANEV